MIEDPAGVRGRPLPIELLGELADGLQASSCFLAVARQSASEGSIPLLDQAAAQLARAIEACRWLRLAVLAERGPGLLPAAADGPAGAPGERAVAPAPRARQAEELA